MPPGSRGPGLGVNIAHGSVAKCVVELVIGVRHMNQQLYQVQTMMQKNLAQGATRAGTTAGRSFGNSFANSARKSLNTVGKSILRKGLKFGTTGFLSAVTFAGWGVKVAAEMEQAEIAMQTLTGSMEKGTKLFEEVRKFAIESPFEFPELEESARALLAFNVPLNDVMRVTKMLGDVASASNIPLKQLADLYGRGKTQHRFFAQDLRELANSSVDIKSSLAESLGVNIEDISELVRKGKLSFDDIDLAFRKMTSQGGRYFEGTEKKARSMGGQYNKLVDSIRAVAEEVGKGLRPAMEAVTQTLLALLPQIEEPLRSFAEMLTPDRLFRWAEAAGVAIASVIDWMELLVSMIQDAAAGWATMLAGGSNAATTMMEKFANSPSFTPLEALVKAWIGGKAVDARVVTDSMQADAGKMAVKRLRFDKDGNPITSTEDVWNNFGERAKSVKDWLTQGRQKLEDFKKPKEPQDWLSRLQQGLSDAGNFLVGPRNKAARNTMNAAGAGLAMAGMSALARIIDPFDAKRKEDERKGVLSGGFVGFEELNRKIQDSLIDQTTEKKIEKNTRETKNVLKDVSAGINKMVGKMTGWSLFVP